MSCVSDCPLFCLFFSCFVLVVIPLLPPFSSSSLSSDSFSSLSLSFPISSDYFFPLQTSLGLIHSKPSAVSGQSPSRQQWAPGAAGGRDPGQEAGTRAVIGRSSDLVDCMYYFQPITRPAKFGIGAGRNIYRCLFCLD